MNNRRFFGRLFASVTAFATLAACYTVSVDYSPLHDLAALTDPPLVRVDVVDARPEDQGLHDDVMIGQYRGSFGIPNQVENGTAGVMPSTVLAATTDALAGAGIAVDASADSVLEATVLQYWADGMVGFGGWIEVRYRLGEWETTIEGTASGNGFFGDPERVVEETIEEALVDLSAQASEAFGREDFQANVR